MPRIVVQKDVAEQIRNSEGQIVLIDELGTRVGIVRRPPMDDEVEAAKARIGSDGAKFTVEELIAKVEAL